MFDPYRKWLAIPEGQRPPTHYQLLGIPADEDDRDVINAAVVRQSAFIRSFQVGRHSKEATQILNEIAAAKLCLLDPVKRAKYDEELARASASKLGGPIGTPAGQHRQPAFAWTPPAEILPPHESVVHRPRPTPASLEPVAADVEEEDAPRSHSSRPWLWIGLTLLGLSVPLSLFVWALTNKTREHPRNAVAATAAVEPVPTSTIPGVVNPVSSAPEPLSSPPSTTAEATVGAGAIKKALPQSVIKPPDPNIEESPSEPYGRPGLPEGLPPEMRDFAKRMQQEEERMQQDAERVQQEMEERREATRARMEDALIGRRDTDDAGEDTLFVGRDGGIPRRAVEPGSLLYGVTCELGAWGRERCIKSIKPVFSREEVGHLPVSAVAREGYAVGAVRVHTINYVNALRLVFMRVKDGGQLDKNDSYASDWIGFRGRGKTYTLTGDGSPIIGIHTRESFILEAMALVVDVESSKSSTKDIDATEEAGTE